MEVLMWLLTQDDKAATIGFYVELARKFLSETKLQAARYLLTDFMAANFEAQTMRMLEEKTTEARLYMTEEQGNLLYKINDPNFQNDVKLLCYLRERARIIALADILEKREALFQN